MPVREKRVETQAMDLISGKDVASTSMKTWRLILPCRSWPCSNPSIYCFLLDLLQNQVSKLSVQTQMPSFPTGASFTGQSQAGHRVWRSAIAGQLWSWEPPGSGFESWCCHLLAVWPLPSYLSSLCLSFLIRKMGIAIVLVQNFKTG